METFENEEIAVEMRKRGKEKLSKNDMQEVMDTVNPGFWGHWKATEKRIAVDGGQVKCDYCGNVVSVVRPSKGGKKAMCNDCEARLSARYRVFVVQPPPLVFSSDSDNPTDFRTFKRKDV